MGTDASTLTVGGRVEAKLHATTLGGEAFRRNWNTQTLMAGVAYAPLHSIPDVNIDAVGVFIEHPWVLGSRTALDLGARIDHMTSAADPTKANLALYSAYHGTSTTSRTDVMPSGRAKLTYQVRKDLDVAAAVGHTARVAEANERFFALRRMGTDWVGNPDLAPARNTGVDLSLSLHRPRVTLTANRYANAVHDYIAVYACQPTGDGGGRDEHVGAVLRERGCASEGSRGEWQRDPALAAQHLGRSLLRPRHSDTGPGLGITATDLAETPPLRARLRARLDDGRWFTELEGVASASQAHVDQTLGEAATPSYAIANLTGGIRRGRLATIGVSNLFDTYFVEHLSYQRDPYRSGVRVAEPGRNLFTNVS